MYYISVDPRPIPRPTTKGEVYLVIYGPDGPVEVEADSLPGWGEGGRDEALIRLIDELWLGGGRHGLCIRPDGTIEDPAALGAPLLPVWREKRKGATNIAALLLKDEGSVDLRVVEVWKRRPKKRFSLFR